MNPAPATRRLARYQITSESARDHAGIVYCAEDPELAAPVQLRVLAPYLALDAAFMARFRQEILAARRLKHPHIQAIYDLGVERDAAFLVTEPLAGRPLSELLREGKPLAVERVAALAEQVAQALDYAHGQGMVHQDLSPDAIIVGPNDQVTVTGFGFGRAVQNTLGPAGQAYAVVAYWSPEQAEGKPASPASDRYALAAILFEMLTGGPPFAGETSLAVLRLIADKPAPAPSERRKDLPGHVDAALKAGLAKLPGERPATAVELVAALKTPPAPPAAKEPVVAPPQPAPVEPPKQVEVKAAVPPVVAAPPALQLLMEFASEPGSVGALCFNGEGTHLASGGKQKQVDIWMLTTKRRLRRIDAGAEVLALAFRSALTVDGILSTGAGVTWQEYRYPKPLFQPAGPLSHAAWVLCGSEYGAAALTRVDSQSATVMLTHSQIWPGSGYDVITKPSAKGRLLAASRWPQHASSLRLEWSSASLSGSTTGYTAILSGSALEVHQFAYVVDVKDATNGYSSWKEYRHKFAVARAGTIDHDSPVASACFSADLTTLYTGCEDGTVHVWDWQRQVEREILRGNTAAVVQLLAPRPAALMTAGRDGSLKLWKLDGGAKVTHCAQHDAAITALAYHEGTGMLAAADEKGVIRLWKLP